VRAEIELVLKVELDDKISTLLERFGYEPVKSIGSSIVRDWPTLPQEARDEIPPSLITKLDEKTLYRVYGEE